MYLQIECLPANNVIGGVGMDAVIWYTMSIPIIGAVLLIVMLRKKKV